MNPLLILAGGGLAFFGLKNSTGNPNSMDVSDSNPPPENLMKWADIRPENQKGLYVRTYDDALFQAAQEKKVPFALLKAHAIRESSLKPSAFRQEPNGKASYGLMQVLWWADSARFADWGYDDDAIGDGSLLYDPLVNARIASEIILDNYSRMKSMRDCINAYNTGVVESKRVAPGNYVDNVIQYYTTLVGREI